MVLPVGLVSLADQDRDVHPLHVHLKLLLTYVTRPLLLLIVYGFTCRTCQSCGPGQGCPPPLRSPQSSTYFWDEASPSP
jgi:hypothetical protein